MIESKNLTRDELVNFAKSAEIMAGFICDVARYSDGKYKGLVGLTVANDAMDVLNEIKKLLSKKENKS